MHLGGKVTPLYLPFEVEGVVRLLNNMDIKLIGPNFANEPLPWERRPSSRLTTVSL